jgi:hypothetical protein
MARSGERRSPGDGDADMDFFGTKITVKNAALARLLNGAAAQDVVVLSGGDAQVSIGQGVSDLDTGAGS